MFTTLQPIRKETKQEPERLPQAPHRCLPIASIHYFYHIMHAPAHINGADGTPDLSMAEKHKNPSIPTGILARH